MGYRQYLAKISKAEHDNLKNLSYDELESRFGEDDFLYAGHIFKNKIFELGDMLNTDKLQNHMSPFFNEDTQDNFDDLMMILSKEGLSNIIDLFREFIIENKQRDLSRVNEIIKGDLDEYDKIKLLQNMKMDLVYWQKSPPYSLKKDQNLIDSSNAEYLIFELVLIYRNFDWDNDVLIILGH